MADAAKARACWPRLADAAKARDCWPRLADRLVVFLVAPQKKRFEVF